MGDSEIVGPPEVGALVTASAVPLERPASLEWPRIETAEELITVVSGKPLEWSARQSFRELLNWIDDDFDLPRARGGAPARDGRACADRADQQCGLHGVLRRSARRIRGLRRG